MKAFIHYGIGVFLILFFFSCSKEGVTQTSLITSAPDGAKVFIDQKYVGNTPLVYHSAHHSGKQKNIHVSLVKEEFHRFVKDGYTLESFNKFELIPRTFTVTFNFPVEPDYFYLEENSVTNLSKVVSLPINSGDYSLRVYKKGYYPLVKKIKVSNKNLNYKLNLEKINGQKKIIFRSEIPGVRLYWDDDFVGLLPFADTLISQYDYHFSFEKKNYQTKKIIFNDRSQIFKNNRNKTRRATKDDPQVIDVSLVPLKSKTYQVSFVGIPPRTTVAFFENEKIVLKNQKNNFSLPQGNYEIELSHHNYLPIKVKLNLDKDRIIPLDFMAKPQKTLPLTYKINLKEKLGLSSKENKLLSLEHNEKYFFLNFSPQVKFVLDVGLNIVERVNFSNYRPGQTAILDRGVFSRQVFSFLDLVMWNNSLYHSFNNQEILFKEVVYSKKRKDKLLILDRGNKNIFIYEKRNPELKGLNKKNSDWDLKGNLIQEEITKFFLSGKETRAKIKPTYDLGDQADFLNENELIFFERGRADIYIYNLENEQIRFFNKNLNHRPLLVEALFVFNNIVFVKGENNRVLVYNLEGEYLSDFYLNELDKRINFLIVKEDFLYLFSEQQVFLYSLK